MIQLFKKANDKAGSEVDPQDPTKQKWNSDAVFVQVENEMVALSELAKFAEVKENEFVAVQSVENELEINGAVHNVLDLINKYQAKKNADEEAKKKEEEAKNKKNEEEKKEEEAKNKKNEEEKKEEDAKNKKNEEEKKEKENKEDEEEEVEGQIKKNNKDIRHFVRLSTARENGTVDGIMTIDTMTNRVERGVNRYGSGR